MLLIEVDAVCAAGGSSTCMALPGCHSSIVISCMHHNAKNISCITSMRVAVAGSTSLGNARESGSNISSRRVHMQAMQDSSSKYPKGVEDIGVNLLRAPKLLLTDAERVRLDESPDSLFYATPRMMQHASIEDLAALTAVYRNILPEGAAVLELCASRYSHLPSTLKLRSVVGQGMNEQELAANSDLTDWFVQDLNEQPLLLKQLESSYDAVLCVNGIQYLTQPELVISEACRVLRPGGFLLIAFGSDCFPNKAVAGWLSRSMAEQCNLVTRIMQAHGFQQLLKRTETGSDTANSATAARFCMLVGTKPANPRILEDQYDTSGMRADNVRDWFTKPGLVGLTDCSALGPDSDEWIARVQPSQEQLLESWRGSYEVLVSDAVCMGIPRSVIPTLEKQATAQEMQAAVQHLQDMVASFLSSGL